MGIQGAAHLFGDDINTDYITPSDHFGKPIEEIATHLFEPIDPAFVDRFEPRDVIVAGENFGSGSSRETAPKALKTAGVDAVIAESFARIFYRNGMAIGLPVVTCEGITDNVSAGDELSVILDEGEVRNETTGDVYSAESIPEALRSVFDAGGLLQHYEQNPDGLRLRK